MADSYAVFVEGLTDLADLGELKDGIVTAARRAVNRTTDRARTRAARAIREQVNFPASYLAPSGGRLTVSKYAEGDDLEGRVRGQERPTSLARFIVGSPSRKAGVTVQVAPGRARRLKRAFLIKLPQGRSSITDTRFNLGLAVRLKPGETMRNKTRSLKLENNLYLLYGPSVQQAFINAQGKGVALDISDELASFMEKEFLRQQELRNA